VREELKRYFRPEFINRLDHVIVFKPLTKEHMKQIVEIMIKKLGSRLKDKKIELVITEQAKEYLAERGHDPTFGARPLRRLIEREIEIPLAKLIIAGEVKEGQTVRVEYRDSELKLEVAKELVKKRGAKAPLFLYELDSCDSFLFLIACGETNVTKQLTSPKSSWRLLDRS
jgi:ATP-dependent Clp protease ATP-binding subunit ClpC